MKHTPFPAYLVALLASPELQNKKRTSFNPLLNAYLLDILAVYYK